jgi:hypothetical protein
MLDGRAKNVSDVFFFLWYGETESLKIVFKE